MQRIKLLALALLTSLASIAFGQSTEIYSLSFKREAILLGAGAGMWGSAHWLSSYNTPLTAAEINALDIQEVPRFERWIVDSYSEQAGKWSDIAQNAALGAPLLIFISRDVRSQWKTVAFMYAETMSLTKGITHLAKTIAQRPRPYMYNDAVELAEKQTKTATRSFFSGHTSQTAALSFLAAKTYSDYHPDSKWRPLVWAAATVLPAATGYLRMKGGKHFLTDVGTGYVVGGAIGYLVPHFHKRKAGHGTGSGWNIVPAGNGVLVHCGF